MGEEKKLYCRLASEFTIEELEAKIGKLNDKYEPQFFNAMREMMASEGPSTLIWIVRELGVHKKDKKMIMDAIDSYNWDHLCWNLFYRSHFNVDGFTEEDVEAIICGKCELLEFYKNAMALYDTYRYFIYKIVCNVIELGYIRLELGPLYNDNKIFDSFKEVDCYLWEHWCKNNDGYETYDVGTLESRCQKIMDFMRQRLSMLQYDIFDYCLNNGLFNRGYKGMSEYERKMAREALEIFEENAEELFEYLIS